MKTTTKTKKTMKLDLHIHTRGSDGYGTPEEIVAQALQAGLDGICITDHHKTVTEEGLKVAELARAKGLLVFRGCEYSTADGHLLVYGCDVAELGAGYYPSMQDLIDAVNAAGGVAIPAHPYKGYRRALRDDVRALRGVPAYEVVNGQVSYQCPANNAKAQEAAKAKKVKGTGGSDAHSPRDVGLASTVFQKVFKTERDFVQALRTGKYEAQLDSSPRPAHRLALDSAYDPRQAADYDDDFWNRAAAPGPQAKEDSGSRTGAGKPTRVTRLLWR